MKVKFDKNKEPEVPIGIGLEASNKPAANRFWGLPAEERNGVITTAGKRPSDLETKRYADSCFRFNNVEG